MTSVLASREGEWFLAAFAPHIEGCNLSTTHEPLYQRDKFHLWQGRVYVQSQVSLSDITLYPIILYHGMKVYPRGWNSDSKNPLLCVYASPSSMNDVDSLYFREIGKRINAKYPSDLLIADGWDRPGQADYTKYVHVDEVEKIEGTPPEDAFY